MAFNGRMETKNFFVELLREARTDRNALCAQKFFTSLDAANMCDNKDAVGQVVRAHQLSQCAALHELFATLNPGSTLFGWMKERLGHDVDLVAPHLLKMVSIHPDDCMMTVLADAIHGLGIARGFYDAIVVEDEDSDDESSYGDSSDPGAEEVVCPEEEYEVEEFADAAIPCTSQAEKRPREDDDPLAFFYGRGAYDDFLDDRPDPKYPRMDFPYECASPEYLSYPPLRIDLDTEALSALDKI